MNATIVPADADQAAQLALSKRLLQALLEDAGAQLEGVPVHLNLLKALDGLAFTAAMLIEGAREVAGTPKADREGAELIRKMVKMYLGTMGQMRETNGGTTMLQAMGGGGGAFGIDPEVARAMNASAHSGQKPN